MGEELDRVLDECIDRLNRGESLESCLGAHPAQAAELRPLLEAMLAAKRAYPFQTDPHAKEAARQRLHAALEATEARGRARTPFLPSLLAYSRMWATAAVLVLIALVGYFALRPWMPVPGIVPTPPGVTPTLPPPVTAAPDPMGNFAFLISDDVNAIADFDSVTVTVAGIGLQRDGGQWIEFEPQVREVDLTRVPGDLTQEMWRGNVPAGRYGNVFIYVERVSGVLKATGEAVAIKLPGEKLHISQPFEVSANEVTSFTFDVTVFATGGAQGEGKYILKPQADQSGAARKPKETREPKGRSKVAYQNRPGRTVSLELLLERRRTLDLTV